MCDHIIETQDGYHVIMLVGKRPPVQKGMDDLRNEIKQRIRREELRKDRQIYIEGLKEKTDIRIDNEAITKIVKELKADIKKQTFAVTQKDSPRSMILSTPPSVPGKRK